MNTNTDSRIRPDGSRRRGAPKGGWAARDTTPGIDLLNLTDDELAKLDAEFEAAKAYADAGFPIVNDADCTHAVNSDCPHYT
jgi:hypothetical protein